MYGQSGTRTVFHFLLLTIEIALKLMSGDVSNLDTIFILFYT